ncbi:MAG TPA: TIGR00297 family protein, partial [Archaeoglobus profundus]|nr:TIGR00297 family protein [Archaeoglobus profundus]
MLPLISMLSPFLDVPYLILLTLILYLFKRSSVNLLATILWALTYLGLCKVLISTSIFMLLGHPKRGIKAITIYSFLAFIYLVYYNFLANLNWSLNYIVFLAVIGGLTASLIESIDIKDKNMVILLALATVYTIFHIYAIDVQIEQLAIAFLISFLLSLFATKAGVADESGLMSATLIGTL